MLSVFYAECLFKLNVIMLSVIMLSVIMLSVFYAVCLLCWVSFMLSVFYAECHYVVCHYVECRVAITVTEYAANKLKHVYDPSQALWRILPKGPDL
jgi:hypothetical protein